MTKTLLIAAITLMLQCSDLIGPSARAQGTELDSFEDRRVVTAVRLEPGESIDVDGRLDEPLWQRIQPATDFRQLDPDNGEPATQRTEVRIAFNDNSLYLGVNCFDSDPEGMRGNTMQRDGTLGGDDRFQFILDTFLDGRTAYFFALNPSGAMVDSTVLPGGRQERSWDGIWNARVERTDKGWFAEIEIPFRTINFDPNAPAWGINFLRTVRRRNEDSHWNGFSRNYTLRSVSNAGLLVGLSEISQGVGLDVRPYLIGSMSSAPEIGRPGDTFTGDLGGDVIYNLTPNLRANFTINTDFAETEVDDRQVNLTRFPLRFPEKRDFFLEGSNFFNLSGFDDAFFSRRIGLNQGRPQRIDYGAKLTGQIGNQDVGALQVRTGEKDGVHGEDFTVVRVRRRFMSASHFGMIYTRRALRSSNIIDPTGPTAPDLHTAGFDFRMATPRFGGNRNLEFESHYVFTSNPDGTGRSGRYGVGISYPNDRLAASARFTETQRNFKPAVGFISRTGTKTLNGSFQFRPRLNDRWIRRFTFGAEYTGTTDPANFMLTREVELTLFRADSQFGDFVAFQVLPQFERLEEDFRMQGDEIVLPAGGEYSFTQYEINGEMAQGRRISFRGNLRWGNYFTGSRRDFSPGFAVRLVTGVLVDVNSEWNRIEQSGGSFSTSVFRTSISSQLSPWISLASTAQYDTVSRVFGWQARFHWVPRPGNDLYFVYTHNWLNDPAGIRTIDRRAASKIVYTHRF